MICEGSNRFPRHGMGVAAQGFRYRKRVLHAPIVSCAAAPLPKACRQCFFFPNRRVGSWDALQRPRVQTSTRRKNFRSTGKDRRPNLEPDTTSIASKRTKPFLAAVGNVAKFRTAAVTAMLPPQRQETLTDKAKMAAHCPQLLELQFRQHAGQSNGRVIATADAWQYRVSACLSTRARTIRLECTSDAFSNQKSNRIEKDAGEGRPAILSCVLHC